TLPAEGPARSIRACTLDCSSSLVIAAFALFRSATQSNVPVVVSFADVMPYRSEKLALTSSVARVGLASGSLLTSRWAHGFASPVSATQASLPTVRVSEMAGPLIFTRALLFAG